MNHVIQMVKKIDKWLISLQVVVSENLPSIKSRLWSVNMVQLKAAARRRGGAAARRSELSGSRNRKNTWWRKEMSAETLQHVGEMNTIHLFFYVIVSFMMLSRVLMEPSETWSGSWKCNVAPPSHRCTPSSPSATGPFGLNCYKHTNVCLRRLLSSIIDQCTASASHEHLRRKERHLKVCSFDDFGDQHSDKEDSDQTSLHHLEQQDPSSQPPSSESVLCLGAETSWWRNGGAAWGPGDDQWCLFEQRLQKENTELEMSIIDPLHGSAEPSQQHISSRKCLMLFTALMTRK